MKLTNYKYYILNKNKIFFWKIVCMLNIYADLSDKSLFSMSLLVCRYKLDRP